MLDSVIVCAALALLAGQIATRPRAFFTSPISVFALFTLLYLGIGGLLTQYVLDFVLANPLPNRVLQEYSYYWGGALLAFALLSQLHLRDTNRSTFSEFAVTISPVGKLVVHGWTLLMLFVGAYLVHATAGSNGFEDRLGGYDAYQTAASAVPVETIFAIGLVFAYVRYLETDSLFVFVPPLLIALPTLYTGSRNFLFQVFFILIALSVSKQGRGKQVGAFVFILFALAFSWAFITLGDGSEIDAALVFYRLFAELGHTTVAGLYSYQYAINADSYNSLLHYVPIINKVLHMVGVADSETYFAKYINESFIQYHFDMSANFLAEGFFYAGKYGVIVHLTVLGLVLALISRFGRAGPFMNILAFLFVAYSRNMVRGSFMDVSASVLVYAVFGLLFVYSCCRFVRREGVPNPPPAKAEIFLQTAQ
jgi:hypothetical protein